MLDFLLDIAATLSISLPYWQEVNEIRINAKTTENQAKIKEIDEII